MTTSITLYWRPGSCARVPFVALEEIGVPYELRVLNGFRGDTITLAFKDLNPKGRVPVLKMDDWVITETPVVLRVLASKFPEAKLLPTGHEQTEIEASETMAWFASTLHPAVARQRFPMSFTVSEEETHWEGVRLAARAELADSFTLLEQRLADREWLFGERSIVDVYMLYCWWRAVGSGMDSRPFPRCADHGQRTEALPTVSTVLDREEAEFSRFEAEGYVPDGWESHYVGRIPAEHRSRPA